jgi:protein-S-isoprenylcysteine O-methyltransferase Ste14
MEKQNGWASVILTLLALAIVYGIGTTFFTVELERLVERTITPLIADSEGVAEMNREIYGGIERFMASRHVRIIGYACLGTLILLALVGLIAGKRALASLGSIGLILPVYAYFIMHMSFLAGLGLLTALWSPFWGDVVKLGDIAYLPYMIVVYPLSLAGIDARHTFAGTMISLGLLLFILGVLAWFYARFRGKGTADFWIYRFTRHPQYLGWILWSYGLMLRVAIRHDTALQPVNRGASLPWVISTLIILCVALSEELRMRREQGETYRAYSSRTPFIIPMPRAITRAIAYPFRRITGRDQPRSGWDLVWVFGIYIILVALLSLPFVVLDWPGGRGWASWPF